MNAYIAAGLLPIIAVLAACQQAPEIIAEADAKAPALSSNTENPIIIELYQSQGCSSCPPANAAVNAVADRPGVIALSFAVTYWDRLGWKDIFGDKAYTQRQYDYAHALGNPNVYTPQIVINGKTAITGIKNGELAKSLASTKAVSGGPSIDVRGETLTVGKGSGTAHIWVVRYDPRTQNVAIRSGENTGRNLPHKNIVRSLAKLGEWNGTEKRYALSHATDKNLKTAILVQRPGAGAIIAAKVI